MYKIKDVAIRAVAALCQNPHLQTHMHEFFFEPAHAHAPANKKKTRKTRKRNRTRTLGATALVATSHATGPREARIS
jgi:hypothetical protein